MKTRHAQQGFSLVELMIALLLGLMVIGGVTSVFLSNKQSLRTNTALSQVQEASRIAFELLSRDIRQAGLSACGNTNRITNTLNNPAGCWWCGFNNALRGYEGNQASAVAFGTGAAARVNGTDAIQLMGVADTGLSITSHNAPSAGFFISAATTDLAPGDIIMVCDPDHAAIMQISNYNAANVRVNHNTGSGSPGNCNNSLNFPTDCSINCNAGGGGNCYSYGPNSQLARMTASEWYIGVNPRGGRSLYQLALRNNGGNAGTQAQEMVRDVTDMQLQYLFGNTYLNANDAALTDWTQVTAVRMTLTMTGADDFTGTDGERLGRSFTASVTARNRVN
ncbi:PilW family protein [Sinimarinibacterium flocculans]|uniref:PilW family protein n=1 Tax=Sinimarinibacterium flocculans TaxID=985250 RepID=UPI0035113A13